MKRFVLSLFVVASAVIALQAASYLVVFKLREKAIDRCYTLSPAQKYLFLGSSQMGCGVMERPEFENRVVWKPSTPLQVSLFQLMELDRRRQLDHVKVVAINVNPMSINFAMRQDELNRAFYRNLPTSLRYVGEDVSLKELLWYGITTAHIPYVTINPVARSPIGPDTKSVVESRDAIHVQKERDGLKSWGAGWRVDEGRNDEAVRRVLRCVREAKKMCDAHGIHLVVLGVPMPKDFNDNLNEDGRAFISKLYSDIRNMGIEVFRPCRELDLDEFADTYHQTQKSAMRSTKTLLDHFKAEGY